MDKVDHLVKKRKEIPGKVPLIIEIGTINAQIKKMEEEIKVNIAKIDELIKAEKEKSPRNVFLAGIFENGEKIKVLRTERKGLFEKLDLIKEKIEKLKAFLGAENLKHSSEDEIKEKMVALDMKLIKESVSPAEEKQIAAELTSLRTKKSKLGDIKENIKSLKELEREFKDFKGKIGQLNKEIQTLQSEIEKCKEELNKLKEIPRAKNPVVEQLFERVKILKAEKLKMFALRDEKRAEIHRLEEEYKKLEQEILLAKELETKKDEIRQKISAKNSEIEKTEKKISQFDSKVFESLYFAIERLIESKRFFISVDVASQLLHHGISIPKDEETARFALKELEEKRDNADMTFKEKTARYRAEIEGIQNEIKALNSELSEMPESNYDLLKRGGYKRQTFA